MAGLPADLTEHEAAVVAATEQGVEAKLPEHTPIRAEVIRALCLGAAADRASAPAGIRVRGALVEDRLDLEWLDLPFPLALRSSRLGRIFLRSARLGSLDLSGTHCDGIVGGRATFDRSVRLVAGFTSTRRVWLASVRIGGDLVCTSASITTVRDDHAALLIDGAHIEGRVLLRGGETVVGKPDTSRPFVLNGRLSAMNARVGGGLVCMPNACFEAEGDDALSLHSMRTEGWTTFAGARIRGGVRFGTAELGGQLTFENASIGGALDLEQISIRGDLRLDGAELGPSAVLRGAQVAGSADFTGARLHRCRSLDLSGARIAGALRWRGIRYEAPEADAPAPDAQDCPTPPTAAEEEAVDAAAEPVDEQVEAPVASRAPLPQQARPGCPAIDLSYADVGVLDEDPGSWPRGQVITLEGFSYRGVAVPAKSDEDRDWLRPRLEWLARQPDERWSPSPYNQLAAALRAAGHEAAAVRVAVEREKRRRRRGGLTRASQVGSTLLGALLGHGYRPWFALVWAAVVVGAGVAAFEQLGEDDFRAKKDGVAPYSGAGYAIDAFLPIVNLHQEEARVPRARGWNVYLWVHIALGWVLTTLGVAGLTGLVRRE